MVGGRYLQFRFLKWPLNKLQFFYGLYHPFMVMTGGWFIIIVLPTLPAFLLLVVSGCL